MHGAQEDLHTCYAQIKLFQLFLLCQYFQYILQLIYLLTFFYADNFHSRNILQHHMIYRIHIHNYLDSKKSFIASTFINQFFAFTPAFIIIPTLLIVKNTCIQSTLAFTYFMLFYMPRFISSWHKPKHFYIISFFFIKYLWMSKISSTEIAS